MGRYSVEASNYASKVSSFKLSINEVSNNIKTIKNKLNGTKESSLKSNVIKKLDSINTMLESTISDATGNVSKISQKASELDALENNKARTTNQVNGNENENQNKDKLVDVRVSNNLLRPNDKGEIHYV